MSLPFFRRPQNDGCTSPRRKPRGHRRTRAVLTGLIVLVASGLLLNSISLKFAAHNITDSDSQTEPARFTEHILDPLPPLTWDYMWPPPLNQPLCLPKIFVYPDDPRMGPFQMGNATVGTAYIAETILLRQLRDPTSAVHRTYVTTNPEEADFFFIPFRGSAYLTYCWFHEGREKKECEAEADVEYVRRMMDHIENDHPYWKRSQGKDHIMIHPMDMTALYYKDRRRFQNATFLTTIGDRRHVAVERRQTRRYHDITIPSATAILDIAKVSPLDYVGPRGHPRQHIGRDIFVIFAGIYRDVKRTDQYSSGIRALLNEGIDKLPGYMITKGWQYEEYAQLLARSKYGLSPQGWTLDTTRVWEYIAFGVVPVIIADGIIMPFEDDIDWDSFTVRIRRADAHRLDQILRSITPEEYERKRQALWEHGRQVLLTRDAWHLIVRQLCRMRDDLVGMKTIPGGKHVSLSLTNATIQTTRFP